MNCFKCSEIILSLKGFIEHLTLIHKLQDGYSFKCCENNCTREYSSLNSFKKHLKSHFVQHCSEKVSYNIPDNVNSIHNEHKKI